MSRILARLDRLERANRRALQRFIDRWWLLVGIAVALAVLHVMGDI